MRILFLGDIVGRAGRRAALDQLPALRRRLDADFVIVNGENAAGGFGITAKIAAEFYDAGADCLTTGNHVWDQRDIIADIGDDHRLLRPVNFPPGTPGRGVTMLEARGGRRVMVINAMARLYMDPLDDPFAALDQAVSPVAMPDDADAIVLDFHGEATSEKMAMGHFLDGRVTLVVGTHSHVPTADAQVLPGGTAYQTDAGMCGDFNSVIGMDKAVPLARFTRKLPTERMTPAAGEGTLCAVFVETDDRTGLALRAEPVRVGGCLSETIPE